MRITTRIAAGGNRSLTRIPFPRATARECLNEAGKIDRIKAQMAFAVDEGAEYFPFMPTSTDDEAVYFAALTFMDLLHDAYQQVMQIEDADVHEGSTCKQDERLEAKMDRGRFVYARMDLKRVADGVRVKLSVGNPHGVVGDSEMEATSFIATCAQLWMRIAEQIDWVRIEADADIIERAKEANRKAALRRDYGECERRCFGGGMTLCAPAKFDCPFYRDGRCNYAEEVGE